MQKIVFLAQELYENLQLFTYQLIINDQRYSTKKKKIIKRIYYFFSYM